MIYLDILVLCKADPTYYKKEIQDIKKEPTYPRKQIKVCSNDGGVEDTKPTNPLPSFHPTAEVFQSGIKIGSCTLTDGKLGVLTIDNCIQ